MKAGETREGRRRNLPEGAHFPPDLEDADYWQDRSGRWRLYLEECGASALVEHEVEEHEDGTITISPSVGFSRSDGEGFVRHGFLERGVWREV